MSFLFDIAIVAIAIVCVVVCRNRGLVRSIIEATGGMVAAFCAYQLAKPAGQWVSQNWIKPLLSEEVAGSLLSIGSTTPLEGKALDAIASFDLSTMLQDAPAALQDLLTAFNINLATVQSVADGKTTVAERSTAVVDTIVSPLAANIATCLCFFVFFVVLMLVVILLAKLASGISYIPVAGKLNRFLGTVFGGVKAVVYICIFTAILHVMIPYLVEPMALDPADPYAGTLICKTVSNINPLIDLIPDQFA